MKAVLISIQPKWVEKIASGEKTIEVRKIRPKIETPFKCYIYATKPKKYYKVSRFMATSDENLYLVNGKIKMDNGFAYWGDGVDCEYLNRKVIGEFVCDRIDSYVGKDYDNREYWDLPVEEWEDLKGKSCLTIKQICDYTGDSHNCYGWHISDLKIYDKPKELGEFGQKCLQANEIRCRDCINLKGWNDCCDTMIKPLTRPPQSWCYVEEK